MEYDIEAEIASSGIADSFLKVSHCTPTRHTHQITLVTFQKIQQEIFMQTGSAIDADDWREETLSTFMFWDPIMRYESLILIFIREGSFSQCGKSDTIIHHYSSLWIM